jgi:hypothetical protein
MEAEFSLGELFEDEIVREWSIEMQRRPRDNHTLRRGLLSGAWVDLVDLVSSRDASVVDKSGMGITVAELSEGKNPEVASVLWVTAASSLYTCKAC